MQPFANQEKIQETNEEFEGEISLEPGQPIPEGAIDEIYPSTVNFSRELYSIYELKRRYSERKTIQLDPDYQRNESWDKKQCSELVESILMGMPLPLFYFFENESGYGRLLMVVRV